MNFLLETFISIAFGVLGTKLLKRQGIHGKMVSICILILSLILFTFMPLMMNDIENGDQYIPQSREDIIIGRQSVITYEAVYDSATIALRTVFSFFIVFIGSFAIAIS